MSAQEEAVFHAIYENDMHALERLASAGLANARDEMDDHALIYAWQQRNLRAIRILLRHGADPLAQTYLGDNLLHLAAKYDWMGLAKLMLKYQKDIDIIGQEGCTALGYALHFGNYDMARFLVRHGANIDVPDELLGKSARQWAKEMLMDVYGRRH